MTIVGIGVKIRPDQREFLEKKAINLSKFLRHAIDAEMRERNEIIQE